MLVTGAGGFIASHLVEALLKEGMSVRALVHYNSRGNLGHLEEVCAKRPKELEILLGDVTDLPQLIECAKG